MPIAAKMRNANAGRHANGPRARIARGVVAVTLTLGALPAAAQDTTPTLPEPTTTTTTTTTTTVEPTSSTTTTIVATTSTTPDASSTTTLDPAAPVPTTSLPALETTPPIDESALDEAEIAELLGLQRQYDELVAEESATLAEYTIRLSRLEGLDAELARFDVDIARTERDLDRAVARVVELDRDQQANVVERRRTATELEAARVRLRDQAVDAFVIGGSSGQHALEAVLGAENSNSAAIAMTYAGVVLDKQEATIEGVEQLERRLEVLGVELADARAEAEDARREIARLERDLEQQRAGLQDERDRAEAERRELDAALASIRSRKAQYDQRLQTMAVESDNITSVLAAAQRDQQRAATIPLLRSPLDPMQVSSTFGPRLHPIFDTVRRHNGLDLSGDLGDPIRAVDDGVVVMAEMRNGFGNTIVIDHGGKIASVYAHQSRFEVDVGDVVQRGELIGRVGSTGWSTGPHLHLEIRHVGMAVDPAGHLVPNEPLDCALLRSSSHAIDRTALAGRPDCR